MTSSQTSNTATCESETSDQPAESTHAQVLKSSAVIGGSQLINIAIGILRTKAMAVLLGPAGFGLFGLFSSVSNLAQTLAGMGVNSSGVRQIAAAVSSGDKLTITETVFVLRRVSVLLGLAGVAVMLLFAPQISLVTFDSPRYAGSVRWLSLAVFFTLVSASQSALIQGMRRIAELARIQIFGALFGTACGIPLVYFLRERGVVPALICVALCTIATSWYYSRKISREHHLPVRRNSSALPLARIRTEAAALLKLGVAFMISGLITMGVAYFIRIIVLHQIGVEATGLYQSAWTLGGLYVGFILQAMAADFYPRLTAQADNNAECNRLVNEQAQVGILLAGPGVIGTLSLAALVIDVFYSGKFTAAVPILRWICLGTMMQVISWPMGYIIVAKAKRGLFVFCEVAWGVVSILFAFLCIRWFGLAGTGIAFFVSYVFHAVMLYAIVYHLSGFRWSRANWSSGSISLLLVGIVFVANSVLPPLFAIPVGLSLTLFHLLYSTRTLATFLTPGQIPAPIARLFVRLGLTLRKDPLIAEVS